MSHLDEKSTLPLWRTGAIVVVLVGVALRMESRFNTLENGVDNLDHRLASVENSLSDNVRWSDFQVFVERLQDKNPQLKVPAVRK